jgi:hypothetical protein
MRLYIGKADSARNRARPIRIRRGPLELLFEKIDLGAHRLVAAIDPA